MKKLFVALTLLISTQALATDIGTKYEIVEATSENPSVFRSWCAHGHRWATLKFEYLDGRMTGGHIVNCSKTRSRAEQLLKLVAEPANRIKVIYALEKNTQDNLSTQGSYCDPRAPYAIYEYRNVNGSIAEEGLGCYSSEKLAKRLMDKLVKRETGVVKSMESWSEETPGPGGSTCISYYDHYVVLEYKITKRFKVLVEESRCMSFEDAQDQMERK